MPCRSSSPAVPASRSSAQNGSGKSTLLRLLAGLDFATSGTLRFEEQLLTEPAFADASFSRSFRRRVGFVFQNPDVQVFNATVEDELAFGPLQLGWETAKVRDRIEAALELVAIPHLRHRPPHRLSAGEKKRVALASVLILEPEVLILDEPTATLDPRSQSRILDLLVRTAGSGRTTIAATHDLDSVEEIADFCLVLQEGRLLASGPPRTILGDRPLLERAGLLHVHTHRHADGEVHAHPHLHRHGHDHEK